MKQIKDFPEALSAANTDKVLIQSEENVTKFITKENFLKGIGNGTGIEISTNSLRVDYRFDNSQLTDYSGNNLHGIVQGATLSDDFSIGYDFGTNKYVELPSDGIITGQSFFISALVFTQDYGNWGRIIELSTALNSNSNTIFFANSQAGSGLPALGVFQNASDMFWTNAPAHPNTWLILSAGYTNGTGYIYINGMKAKQSILAPSIQIAPRPYSYIGKSIYSSDSAFFGSIARLCVWSKFLSKEERLQNLKAFTGYAKFNNLIP